MTNLLSMTIDTSIDSNYEPTFYGGDCTISIAGSSGTTAYYLVKYTNELPYRISFSGMKGLVKVGFYQTDAFLTSTANMFYDCSALTSVTLPDLSYVTNTSYMFSNCTSLTTLDLSSWNTTNVTTSSGMFDGWSTSQTVTLSSDWTIDISDYNATFIRSKIKLAKYTFDNSVGDCLPTLTPNTIIMTSEDTVSGTTTTRTVYVDDHPTQISFSRCASLLTINYLKIDENITSMYDMFGNCTALSSVNASNWNTSQVTDMTDAFWYCISLTSLDVSNWDTSNVSSMYRMFRYCPFTSFDASNFKTNKLTNVNRMFSQCHFLTSLNLSGWDTSNITDMGYLFTDCKVLTSLDLSDWDTSSVTNMEYMFNNLYEITSLKIDNFNTSQVTNMYSMFNNCTKLTELDLTMFNTKMVTNSSKIFTNWTSDQIVYILSSWTIDVSSYSATFIITFLHILARYTFDNTVADCLPTITGATTDQWGYTDTVDGNITTRKIGSDLDELPTITQISFSEKSSLLTVDYLRIDSNITNMGNMFYNCSSLTSLNLSNFNTENVTNMDSMFYDCSLLTSLDVSNFNTENVTSMNDMFANCFLLTSLNVSNFNTENVTNMDNMFYNCSSLTSLDVSNFNTENVTNMGNMFYNCSSLTSLDVSNFNTENVTDMQRMFQNCSSLTSLDVSNFNTQNVTNMYGMFRDCSLLTSLDVSLFNTQNVTNMVAMFRDCSLLTSLDVSLFNTQNVTGMYGMFQNCSSLTTLDVSNFNTQNVTGMYGMFQNCSSLTTLDVSNFNTQNVTSMQIMFYGCSSLISLDVSNFNTENVTNISEMFRGCSSLTSLDLSNFNTSQATTVREMFVLCESLTFLDISSFDVSKDGVNTYNMFYSFPSSVVVGMVHCNSSTINKISDRLAVNTTIWYMDAKLEDLTEKENITYKEYKMNILESDEEIELRSNGDVYDELNLLTGELTQRIDENGEILAQEIIKTINLKGKPSINWQGDTYLHLENNTLYPQLDCEVESINYYEIPKLKANTLYTLRYVGEPTQCIFGGLTYRTENNMILTSGSSDNLLYFDKEVRKVILIEGDVRDRNFDYFEGIESLGAIEIVTHKTNMPIFAKGGRK